MTAEKPDIQAIMAEIRRDAAIEGAKAKVATYQPLSRTPAAPQSRPTLYSDELNYLNAHWADWFDESPGGSHRRFFGGIVSRIKLRLRRFLRAVLLPDYYRNQEQFIANLVRHLNDNARYIDARVQQIFWENTHKVDQDIAGVNARCDRAIDEVLARTEQRLEQLEAQVGEDRNQTAPAGRHSS